MGNIWGEKTNKERKEYKKGKTGRGKKKASSSEGRTREETGGGKIMGGKSWRGPSLLKSVPIWKIQKGFLMGRAGGIAAKCAKYLTSVWGNNQRTEQGKRKHISYSFALGDKPLSRRGIRPKSLRIVRKSVGGSKKVQGKRAGSPGNERKKNFGNVPKE